MSVLSYHRNCAVVGCENTVWSKEPFNTVYCAAHEDMDGEHGV